MELHIGNIRELELRDILELEYTSEAILELEYTLELEVRDSGSKAASGAGSKMANREPLPKLRRTASILGSVRSPHRRGSLLEEPQDRGRAATPEEPQDRGQHVLGAIVP